MRPDINVSKPSQSSVEEELLRLSARQYAVERLKDNEYLVPTAEAGMGNWLLTDKGRAEAAQLERIRAGLPRGTDLHLKDLL